MKKNKKFIVKGVRDSTAERKCSKHGGEPKWSLYSHVRIRKGTCKECEAITEGS